MMDNDLSILVRGIGKRYKIGASQQRADTLRPGQGLGLSLANDIIEQYDGQIIIGDSPLGGASMRDCFGLQQGIELE